MSDTSQLQLRIFDGSRQPFTQTGTPTQFLVTIIDGNQQQILREYYTANSIDFDVPFYDNLGDKYTVVVWASGYMQAGFTPVNLSNQSATTVDIMLVKNSPGSNFSTAPWSTVDPLYPFLGSDTDAATAQTRYENLMETSPVLACMLNLIEAMSQIKLGTGSPLDYIKQIRWDMPPAQDRFFAYCDAAMVDLVKAAAANGEFAVEVDPGLLHPGATASWKQIQFGEANVQLTFHQNPLDCIVIDGVSCVTLEPDIDYYEDFGAHVLLEVIPNAFSGMLTNPVEVYVLRWIAGQQADIPPFAPLYTLT